MRRYIGFGAYDPELIVNCANDRATLWAVSTLNSDQSKRFRILLPAAMSGKALPHRLSATLALAHPAKAGCHCLPCAGSFPTQFKPLVAIHAQPRCKRAGKVACSDLCRFSYMPIMNDELDASSRLRLPVDGWPPSPLIVLGIALNWRTADYLD